MSKTKKALLKRFKITKTGKILRLSYGQNHYRTKKSGNKKRKGKKLVPLSKSEIKRIKKYLSF